MRKRSYSKALTINLRDCDELIISYYAHRYRKYKGEIIRGIIRSFASHDSQMSKEKLMDFLENSYIPEEASNEHEATQLREAMDQFSLVEE